MIVQHEQQHDETMLATHQLRDGAAGARRAAAAAGAGARRSRRVARCWSRPARSPWAPPPSRGRWTTSGPAHVVDLPAFVIDAPGHERRSTPSSSTPAATTTRAGGATPAGRTASRRGWSHRGSGSRDGRRHVVAAAVRRRRAGAGRRAGRARVLPRGRGLRALGGQAAAHRGGVGEGGPVRPGDRPLAALPVGRRRPDRRAREPRPAPPAARPGRRLPGGRVAAGRAPADRRRVGVDAPRAGTPTRASRCSRTRSTRRCSSAATTGCCAAARSAPTRRRSAATFRNWDHPIRRQIFAGFRARPRRRPGGSGG